jgi:hypothetical protein
MANAIVNSRRYFTCTSPAPAELAAAFRTDSNIALTMPDMTV